MAKFIACFLAGEDCFAFRGILTGVTKLDGRTGFDDGCVEGVVALLPLLLQQTVLGLCAG